MDLLSVFVTGLFAGGLTCLAVQGGLLASSLAQTDSESHTQPVLSFLVSRLLAYTFLGLALGLLGTAFQLSLTVQIGLQLAAVVFMLGTAGNLLNLHPVFRYFVIQPPRFLTRLVKNQSRNRSAFGPALLGAATVFIPCGATQAMMALAVSTGSPFKSAAIMTAFIAGTSPLFFALGVFARHLGQSAVRVFQPAAAIAIVLIALYNLNSAITLTGSSYTAGGILAGVTCAISFCPGSGQVAGAAAPVFQAAIYFERSGYQTKPGVITAKAGSNLTLQLINDKGSGCIQQFTIPSLNVQRLVPMGQTSTLEITVPDTPGPLAFMCGMGMYRGTINVI